MQHEKNDEVVIEKIRNGDRSQLAAIYKTYRSEFMTWITTNYQCSRDEARDVYQISVLALYENIISNKLQNLTSSLKTYLFAIGKNKVLEFRKADARFDYDVDSDLVEFEEAVKQEKLEEEIKLDVMEHSLNILGDPCKSLLELYYFHDMTMEEIANKLSYKNRETAKNLKCKCLARLRKIFAEQLHGTAAKDILN